VVVGGLFGAGIGLSRRIGINEWSHPAAVALGLTGISLAVVAYQVSFGAVTWLNIIEGFPLQARGRVMSLSVALSSTVHLMVLLAYHFVSWDSRAILLWAQSGLTALCLVVLCVTQRSEAATRPLSRAGAAIRARPVTPPRSVFKHGDGLCAVIPSTQPIYNEPPSSPRPSSGSPFDVNVLMRGASQDYTSLPPPLTLPTADARSLHGVGLCEQSPVRWNTGHGSSMMRSQDAYDSDHDE